MQKHITAIDSTESLKYDHNMINNPKTSFPRTTTLPRWKRLCASMTRRAVLAGDKNLL